MTFWRLGFVPTFCTLLERLYLKLVKIECIDKVSTIESDMRKFLVVEGPTLYPLRIGGFNFTLLASSE